MTYKHKMTPLPESYNTASIEKKWQDAWSEQKVYAWDENVARADSYVIDTPPPTVSGHLHMGHVFSYTQADFVARYQRMSGKNVFYPMGFDDNGLPTERLVEKLKKVRATDMSREDFIKLCGEVTAEVRKDYRALLQAIALSVDWAQEYSTISDDVRKLSQLSFLDLAKKGHVYRELKPFYWDPVDQTAIAQAEIVDKEMNSFQNIILFTIDGKPAPVMTTRPELIPACVALMCHPDDAAKYKGKKAVTPLFNIEVPIIADEKVDKEKGTGLVMCCTFGDDTDKEWWAKYKLETRVILNKYGKLRNLPEGFKELEGKKVSNPDPKNLGARETIIAMLKEKNLLTEQKPITHAVKTAERSGAPLEILPTQQWFVRVLDKKEALKAKSKECHWYPDWMQLRMEQWIDGLNQDWCISRQRYFGVPFPVWYAIPLNDAAFKVTIYAEADELPINPLTTLPRKLKATNKPHPQPEFKSAEALEDIYREGKVAIKKGEEVWVYADADVMDTWATSSISPQITARGLSLETATDKKRFASLYPADLRPQAHEIIRTWAFYTLVKSYMHNQQIPWTNLMISGWCLAEDKTKMSKSKGNVVTPEAVLADKGTDAVRYWAGTSRLGQDTAFSPDLLKIGKKLVTKLWNATAFAAIHLEKMTDAPTTAATDKAIIEILDQWILSRLGETVQKATQSFAAYEYAEALDATNQFFWADFCDNYLELIKKRVYNEDGSFSAARQQSAVRTLYYTLETILKLYAPFTPHVTEELYSHIFANEYASKGSLHARGQWPDAKQYFVNTNALEIAAHALGVLILIRVEKSSTNRSIKFPIDKLVMAPSAKHPELWMDDVAAAGNVRAWEVSPHVKPATLEITFADAADAA